MTQSTFLQTLGHLGKIAGDIPAPPCVIEFEVHGKAQPAGSKNAYVITNKHTGQPLRSKTGRIIVNVSDSNLKSKEYKAAVAFAARQEYRGPLLTGPVRLIVTEYRVRPAGHFSPATGQLNKKGRETPFPISKPDALKVARCVEDALTKVVWVDDSQVVDGSQRKVWGETAKIEVRIEQIV